MSIFAPCVKVCGLALGLFVALGFSAHAQLATPADEFIPRLNAVLDGADGGVSINATREACADGLCPFTGFEGHVQGTLAINADGSLGVVAIIQPLSSGQMGLFFATVAASLNMLAPAAAEERRAAAMSKVIQHVVTQRDSAFVTTIGNVMMAVDVVAPTHLTATFSSAE